MGEFSQAAEARRDPLPGCARRELGGGVAAGQARARGRFGGGGLGRKTEEQGWDLQDKVREALASGVQFKGTPKKLSNK